MADTFVYAGDKVPIGGIPGQVLTKIAGPNYYTAWRNPQSIEAALASGLPSSVTFNNSGSGGGSSSSYNGAASLTVSYNTIGAAAVNQTTHVGTTPITLNRASANLALTGISSIALPGATSGTLTIQPSAATGSAVITFPAVTGTVVTTGDTGSVTGTMIANGTIGDVDIASGAAIAHSKLAALTAGQVLLGNSINVPTGTALSGDITVNSSGVVAISSGVIVNADISGSAAIAYGKLAALPAGQIIVGSAANVPTAVAMSGDVTISSSGVTTIGSGKVTDAMLAGSISPTKITGTAMTVSGFAAGDFDGILDEGSY
jgi:hypothetical protein